MQITVDQVLAWNMAPAHQLVSTVRGSAEQIEQSIEAAAASVRESYPYFEGSSGDALRTQFEIDRKECLITVDILNSLATNVEGVTTLFEEAKKSLEQTVADIAASEHELFYTGDGTVASRKANWEYLADPAGFVEKTVQSFYYQDLLRIAMSRVMEADERTQAAIGALLENLPDTVRTALISMPTDPRLIEIMTKYQVDGSGETVVFPSGVLLEAIRAAVPGVEPKSMSAEEAAALTALFMQPGGAQKLQTFYDIQEEAQIAAEQAYSFLPEDKLPLALADGHGDAFRHTYWNARMTQEFGADWTQTFTTGHEKLGGNPAAREAMDLYNNELGRTIGQENLDATPEELRAKVQSAINDNRALVLVDSPTGAQIGFSNSETAGRTVTQPGSGVPMPKGTR
ncbi:DUF6973 domain-containing protein [Nocardia thailandica]